MKDAILKVLATLGVLNFATFLALDIFVLGGDALSGKIEGARYYLGNHGAFREVSEAIFIYSAVHAYTGLLGLAVAGFIGLHYKRRGR